MATISKLTKSGVLSVNGSIDEYTLPTNWTTTEIGAINTNDTLMFAYDTTANQYWIGKNGSWYNSPTTTGANLVGTGSPRFFIMSGFSGGVSGVAGNFKTTATYTVPSGFTVLTTAYADSAYNSQGWTTGTVYTAGSTGAWVFTYADLQRYSGGARSVALSSGKYYFEVTITNRGATGYWQIGMANSSIAGGYDNFPNIFAYDGTVSGGIFPSSPKFKVTANTIQAYSFDEYTLASGGVSQSLKNNGTWQVKSEFDEVSFSSGSISLNGTNQYLTVPTGTAFQYGTGDFTAEGWVYRSVAWTAQNIFFGQWSGSTGGTTLSWVVMTSNDTNGYARFLLSTNGSGVLTDSISSTVIPLNQWNHIAFVRNGSTFTLYLNGISVVTYSSASALYAATNTISIGASSAATQPFNGYISNVRIVKGTALYTSNFIPPHTSILPAVGNTSLLINCLNSTDFINDYSVNKFNVTNNGSATFSTSSPYLR